MSAIGCSRITEMRARCHRHASRTAITRRITGVLAASLVLIITISCRRAPRERPAQVVSRLAGLPHGLTRLSPEDRALLAAVRKNPDPYLPAIRERVRLPAALPSLLEPRRRQEFFGSLQLLFAIGNRQAFQIADSAHREILAYLEPQWGRVRDTTGRLRPGLAPLTSLMVEAERAVLDLAAGAKDVSQIPNAVRLLRVADYSSAMNALQYLLQVAAGDSAIARQAQSAVQDRQSALYGDPSAAILSQALFSARRR